jgi:hypothetical protein
MKIEIHHHYHGGSHLKTAINKLGEQIMSRLDDFQAALSSIDAETTRIGNKINDLVSQLQRTDLTDAQEADVLNQLTAATDRLKAIGADPVVESSPVEETNPATEQTPE